MSLIAKLFMDDGDQAVCLPEEFRFEGTEPLGIAEGNDVDTTSADADRRPGY